MMAEWLAKECYTLLLIYLANHSVIIAGHWSAKYINKSANTPPDKLFRLRNVFESQPGVTGGYVPDRIDMLCTFGDILMIPDHSYSALRHHQMAAKYKSTKVLKKIFD
jgi:hypothetical protein